MPPRWIGERLGTASKGADRGPGRKRAAAVTMPFMSTYAIPSLAVTVVDDEPMAQDVLVRAARHWNFECQTAGSAEQALELLERNLTPIVVTDLRMPGRGGLWLIQ